MADDPEFVRQVREMGAAIVRAMHDWADQNGSVVDSRLPVGALHLALVRTLEQMPLETRLGYIEDFTQSLQKRFRLS